MRLSSAPGSRALRAAATAVAVAIAAMTTFGTAGCRGSSAPAGPDAGPPVLEPMPGIVPLNPGEAGALRFLLRTGAGSPLPRQAVSFAFVDDPTTAASEARGATLAAETALTDATGFAETRVTAGLVGVFRVHAAAAGAEADVVVVVATGARGSVLIVPFFPPGSAAAPDVDAVEVVFYDDESCARIPLSAPPASARDAVTLPFASGLPTGDGAARFDQVSSALGHAVLGRARDGTGATRAAGCVDLAGPTLVAGGVVQVALPLPDASPDPVGRYQVTSQLVFQPPLPAAAAAAAPWQDLQDCPLDPAQLWLDCTIDALDGPSAGDPLDCVPGGGEGALADALAARRGAPGAGAATAGGALCRPARDGAGAPSLDAMVTGLFGSPPPALLAALPPVAADAAAILGQLGLRSDLTIAATTAAGVYSATHRFDTAELTVRGVAYDVALAPLGLPVLEADFVPVTAAGGGLTFGTQAITLRLGSVARAAFAQAALVPRGLPAASGDLVTAIADLARGAPPDAGDGGARVGCAALDALLCADVGRAAGCLGTACADGLAALAARLDAGFQAADGSSTDLVLVAGTVPLLDPHGTGFADRLGDRFGSVPRPGLWQAQLPSRAGTATVTGVWDALRTTTGN
jgi:hypothetical protein